MGLSEDRKDDEAARGQSTEGGALSALGWQPVPSLGSLLQRVGGGQARGRIALGRLLPVRLGVGAQGRPPLDCSGSPRSKGSRALGLYSRLGRVEASRILPVRAPVSAPTWPVPEPSSQGQGTCPPAAGAAATWVGSPGEAVRILPRLGPRLRHFSLASWLRPTEPHPTPPGNHCRPRLPFSAPSACRRRKVQGG